MRIGDGAAIPVIIADLTRDGCRIVTDAVVAPDSACRIGIANVGLTAGQLVWQGADGYGCAFDVSLPSGAVTAAFGGSNIAVHPALLTEVSAPAATGKLSPRNRLWVFVAMAVGGWAITGGIIALAL